MGERAALLASTSGLFVVRRRGSSLKEGVGKDVSECLQ